MNPAAPTWGSISLARRTIWRSESSLRTAAEPARCFRDLLQASSGHQQSKLRKRFGRPGLFYGDNHIGDHAADNRCKLPEDGLLEVLVALDCVEEVVCAVDHHQVADAVDADAHRTRAKCQHDVGGTDRPGVIRICHALLPICRILKGDGRHTWLYYNTLLHSSQRVFLILSLKVTMD